MSASKPPYPILPSPAPRERLHTRRYEFNGYRRADGLWDIEGRMTDVKSYGFDNDYRGRIGPEEPLHDMRIRLTLDDDFVVRDIETARMAIQSSLTGHLVFSTLHTNDSAGAVSRLLDLGVEPYLVSSSVIAIIAQRLVRRICPDCKQPAEPQENDLRMLGLDAAAEARDHTFYVGAGCDRCFQTGYRGRTGIYELMLVNEEIQNLIYNRENAGTIKKVALNAGLQTLRMDGARKVLAGMTTVSEVLRVTQSDIV